jgi:hypothetical protein
VCVCGCMCVGVCVCVGGWVRVGGDDWQRGRREFVPVMDTPPERKCMQCIDQVQDRKHMHGEDHPTDHHLDRYLTPRGQAPPLLTTGS